MKTADIRLPSNIQDAITQGHREFSEHQRFQTNYPSGVLRGFTPEQKLQHLRDSVFNALAQVGRDDGGQPPMIERFREATIWVDFLESKGVPFGVCQKSKMNQALLGLLNEKATQSNDNRKSRRKRIKPGAVQNLLRKIRQLRACNALIKIPPYSY